MSLKLFRSYIPSTRHCHVSGPLSFQSNSQILSPLTLSELTDPVKKITLQDSNYLLRVHWTEDLAPSTCVIGALILARLTPIWWERRLEFHGV